jgi:hypothetical protein
MEIVAILLIVAMVRAQLPTEPTLTISLVRSVGTVTVARDVTQIPVSLEIATGSDSETIATWLAMTNQQLADLINIPAIKSSPDLIKTFITQSNSIGEILIKIGKSLNLVQKYRSPGIKTPTLNPCAGSIMDNFKVGVFTVRETIKNSYESLKSIWKVGSIETASDEYNRLQNFLNDARSVIQDLDMNVENHLHILESVTSGSVSPAITATIQRFSCISDADFDKITLKKCQKVDNGLLCNFIVDTYSTTTVYKHYIPVNYYGVAAVVPEGHILVKSFDNDESGLIKCEEEKLSIINSCKFVPWENAKHLFEKDPIEAVENNNFSFTNDILPRQLMDNSVLIMDRELDIKVTSPDGKPDVTITNLSPFILSFYKNDSLLLTKDKVSYKFNGALETQTVQTQISIFNYTTTGAMRTKAIMQSSWSMSWPEIARYAGLILQVVVAPVALTTCSLSVYAIIRAISRRRQRSRHIMQSQRMPMRHNYNVNKKFTRSAGFPTR